MYLFLPAYMRGQMLVIDFSGVSSVSIGDMELASGMAVDALTDGAKLRLGKDGGTVTVTMLDGDRVELAGPAELVAHGEVDVAALLRGL